METPIVTILDNNIKPVKERVLKDGNLNSFYQIHKTEAPGVCKLTGEITHGEIKLDKNGNQISLHNGKLEPEPEDWFYKICGFETEEDYKSAIKRPKRTGGSSVEEIRYSNTGTGSSVGGAPAGTKFVNATVTEVFDKIFSSPYKNPTVTLTTSTTLYDKYGDLPTVSIKTTASNGTKPIESVITKAGNVELKKENKAGSYVYSYEFKEAKTTTFTAIATDSNGKTGTGTLTIEFVPSVYYGVIDATDELKENFLGNLTEDMIKGLKTKLTKSPAGTYKGFKSSSGKTGRFIFAIPKNLLASVASVIDKDNNLNYSSSVLKTTMKINGEDYNIVYAEKWAGYAKDVNLTIA